MKTMLAAVILCLIGLTIAQRPTPCTTPQSWEARIYDTDEKDQWRAEGRISYDAVYHRERIADEVDDPTGRHFYDILALFDSKIEYIYNYRARNCTRRELMRPWRNFGINPNDTSFGEAYVGSSGFPGAGVLVTIWGGNFTTPQNHTFEYVSQWTYNGCLPVARTTFTPSNDTQHLSFFDVTIGIRDPNVFIPRRECISDYEWEHRYEIFGKPTEKFH